MPIPYKPTMRYLSPGRNQCITLNTEVAGEAQRLRRVSRRRGGQ